MRARQAMQTGGSRRSARRVRSGRNKPVRAVACGASRPSSARPVSMEVMIELRRPKLKERSAERP
jgi:hypothetical protein